MEGKVMLRFFIPVVTVALLGNSILSAQQYSNTSAIHAGVVPPSYVLQVAQADRRDLQAVSDDALLPPSNSPELVAPPEPSGLIEDAVPEVSAPFSLHDPQVMSLGEPTPQVGKIDFNEVFAAQSNDHALTQSVLLPSAAEATPADCGCNDAIDQGCEGGQCLMPYREPILPPATSFYGFFNANPCHADLWADYPAQAARACAKAQRRRQLHAQPPCVRGELVGPCR